MIVHVQGDISEEEKQACIQRAEELHKGTEQLDIKADGEYVEITYHLMPYERTRRITGYLVGTVDRWNDAKRAELADRVKHSV